METENSLEGKRCVTVGQYSNAAAEKRWLGDKELEGEGCVAVSRCSSSAAETVEDLLLSESAGEPSNAEVQNLRRC